MSERGGEIDEIMETLVEVAWPTVQDSLAELDELKTMLGEGQEYREYAVALTHDEPARVPGPDGSGPDQTREEMHAWATRAGHRVSQARMNKALGPDARQLQKLIDGFQQYRQDEDVHGSQ